VKRQEQFPTHRTTQGVVWGPPALAGPDQWPADFLSTARSADPPPRHWVQVCHFESVPLAQRSTWARQCCRSDRLPGRGM